MSHSELQPKARIGTGTAFALGVVAGFIVGYTISTVSAYLGSVAPEYHCVQTIDDVAKFVRTNGAWPSSWTVLGRDPLEGVVVNWSINIGTCDRHDVMTAIMPVTRRYQTYPHAQAHLDDLWQAVQERRNAHQ